MHATPWALDELESPDLFAMPAEQVSVEQAGTTAEHDEDVHAHYSAQVARAEAEAYARGRADAETTARQAADSRIASALNALSDALESVRMHEERWTANAEENISALSIVVARHVVQREVEADPDVVRGLVQRALSQFPMDQLVTVRLHPDDVAVCGTLLGPDAAGRVRDARWIPDAHMTRGGCLVEGRERIIDGRVDTSLERAYRAIGQVQA